MKKFRLAFISMFVLAAMLLAGCSSNVGEHSSTYFSQMKNVITTASNSSRLIAEAEAEAAQPKTTTRENALATPANFTISEDGSYSFDTVEGAQYYLLYVYYDGVSQDAQYTSDKIYADGATVTGNLNDLGHFNYYNWNIRVAAYPDYETSDKEASDEAQCNWLVSGAVEFGNPSCDYMWTVSSNKMTIKVKDIESSETAFPATITLTLTNTADASDVVTVVCDDIESTKVTMETTECKAGAEYSIKADFEYDPTLVTNPSYSFDGGVCESSSTENLITGTFYYGGDIFNNFNFPHYQANFDPVKGGDAGMWYNDGSDSQSMASCGVEEDEDEDKSCYFEATPTTPADGAEYSYTIHVTSPAGDITATPKMAPGSSTTKHIFGTMNIYADGTFEMTTEYQYIKTDAMNSAVYYVPQVTCPGTYTVNADGTLNLSYDHENAYEGTYDILTEVTGMAKEYYAANPEEDPNYSSGNQGGMMGPDAQQGGDQAQDQNPDAQQAEGAPAEGEAPAEETPAEGAPQA